MACSGCLGKAECWVCYGRGELDRPDLPPVRCATCEGTGRCPLCSTAPLNIELAARRPAASSTD